MSRDFDIIKTILHIVLILGLVLLVVFGISSNDFLDVKRDNLNTCYALGYPEMRSLYDNEHSEVVYYCVSIDYVCRIDQCDVNERK